LLTQAPHHRTNRHCLHQPHPDQQLPTITQQAGQDEAKETDSEADESDDTFTHLGYNSDPDLWFALLFALSQAADRSAANARRVHFMNSPPLNPTTVAKVGKQESKWLNLRMTLEAGEKTKV
jgi:hypothetical protein